MPILISSFSHKGGVGKTTDIHNIACVLTKEFKLRVLLIDADPQCNLTSVIMNHKFRTLGKKTNEEEGKEELESLTAKELSLEEAERGEELFYTEGPKTKRNTIYKCFETAGGEFSSFADETELLRRVNEDIEIQEIDDYPGLCFLAGDLQMISLDMDLSRGFTFGSQPGFGHFARYPRSVTQLFNEIGKKHKVDIILIDLNPGASALNQAIVMGSDYFIVSNLPDFYSRRAIDSITRVIKTWKDNIAPFQDPKRTTDFFQMPNMGPRFLGYFVNRVKIRTVRDVTGPIKTQASKIELLKQDVNRKLLEIPGITSPNFKMISPPLIKEFDRTAGDATESGMSMSYVMYDKLDDVKSTTLKRNEVRNVQKFYLNSFFSAIKMVFSNLSDEHHLMLRNKFRDSSNIDLTREGGHKKGKIAGKKRKKASSKTNICKAVYKGCPIGFLIKNTKSDGNCALYATGFSREEVVKSVQARLADPNTMDDTTKFLIEEVQEAFVSGSLTDSRYEKLKAEHSTLHREYEDSLQDLMRKYPALEGKSVNEKIAYVHSLGEIRVAVQFLDKYRKSTKAHNALKDFYKEHDTVTLFIDEGISQDRFWLGTQVLRLHAKHNNINLRIWKQKGGSAELTLMEPEIMGGPTVVDILYEHGDHFRGLGVSQQPVLFSSRAKSATRPLAGLSSASSNSSTQHKKSKSPFDLSAKECVLNLPQDQIISNAAEAGIPKRMRITRASTAHDKTRERGPSPSLR